VENVPGILVKSEEKTRGKGVAGLSVKVADGFFLIGLSVAEAEQNVTLLKGGKWFDIPIVYADGSRAILAVEKGGPGELAFDEAFKAWSAGP
jgi:hypothetical protein